MKYRILKLIGEDGNLLIVYTTNDENLLEQIRKRHDIPTKR